MPVSIHPPGSFAANRRLFLYSILFLSATLLFSSCNNQTANLATADQSQAVAPVYLKIYNIYPQTIQPGITN
jgi:hypothetical protein